MVKQSLMKDPVFFPNQSKYSLFSSRDAHCHAQKEVNNFKRGHGHGTMCSLYVSKIKQRNKEGKKKERKGWRTKVGATTTTTTTNSQFCDVHHTSGESLEGIAICDMTAPSECGKYDLWKCHPSPPCLKRCLDSVFLQTSSKN